MLSPLLVFITFCFRELLLVFQYYVSVILIFLLHVLTYIILVYLCITEIVASKHYSRPHVSFLCIFICSRSEKWLAPERVAADNNTRKGNINFSVHKILFSCFISLIKLKMSNEIQRSRLLNHIKKKLPLFMSFTF